MKKVILLILLILPIQAAIAQDKVRLSGQIRDSASNEDLIGVSVYIKEIKAGASSNVYGFYSLSTIPGEYVVRFSLPGYETREIAMNLDKDIRADIELKVSPLEIESVTVTADAPDENIKTPEMSVLKINPVQLKKVPVLFGEQDLLKAIQLMPGVQSAGEGNSGFYVRGGGADQNLILLDEAIVYNASHLLGFFSVFNSDAIRDARLIKGSGSSEYGGRLSSVLDIRMKEGNSKRFVTEGGVGLISSRLSLEAPLVKDKSSFILAGRRTYFDLFLKASNDENTRKTQLYFYDLNAKANYILGKNDRLFLSGYFGRDVLGYKGEFGIDWGNSTGTMRWNHIFNSRLFSNSSLIFSHYKYEVGITNGDELINIGSSIKNISLKEDFQYFVDSKNIIKFGLQGTYHTFTPGEIKAEKSSINALEFKKKYGLESAAYVNHEFQPTDLLSFDYGLRYSSFAALGPGEVFSFDQAGVPTGSTEYGSGKLIKYYGGIEPRVSASYMLDFASSVKASYARNMQYLHLLSTSTTTTPFDLWHPSTKIVKPGIADQFAVGYFRNFEENKYETSVEVYYKNLQNQVDYKNGADIFFNEYVESQLVFGKGRTYGLELYARKNEGRLTGWLSYTLARAQKKFEAINNGDWFRARQDRTHDLELVTMYDLSRSWTLGVNWVYYTGNAVTFPSGKYVVDNHVINMYTERNGYRMPAYHRLDLAFTWQGKRSSWNFSLYNAYGHRNAYSIYFRTAKDDPGRTEAVRIALFTFFPSITYNFSF